MIAAGQPAVTLQASPNPSAAATAGFACLSIWNLSEVQIVSSQEDSKAADQHYAAVDATYASPSG